MIELNNIAKTFETKEGIVEALCGVSLSVERGDIYGIIGLSGAGKSTLVRCINMLERPDSGSIVIDGVNLCELSEVELRQFRRKISMIFQDFNLLAQRNVLKNVMFPLELVGIRGAKAKKKALELLEVVGLSDKAKAYPSQLSGGQQQRVAIARALATDPEILLCDEATSALDPSTTHSILELIRQINEDTGITVIIITHSMSVVEDACNHVAVMDGGLVVERGTVNEIFTHPESEMGRLLVMPDSENKTIDELGETQLVLRVVFDGTSDVDIPLVARMATETGIEASIIYASTKSVGGKPVGSMLLGFADKQSYKGACDYLDKVEGVEHEEVKN